MSDELKKHGHELEDELSKKSKRKRSREENTDKEVLGKKKEYNPAINLAVNMLKLSHINQEREPSEDFRSVTDSKQLDADRTLLKERLQEKLSELLEEEQALIELYVKAAKAAKEKEDEYKGRIKELVEQTERDRQLLEIFRSI